MIIIITHHQLKCLLFPAKKITSIDYQIEVEWKI